MKATRESESKETASDERDLSLKHFPVFIFAASSSFSLSPLSGFVFLFQVIPFYFWHKVINSINENESSLLLYQCSTWNFSSSQIDKSCSQNYEAAKSAADKNKITANWCGRIQI